jgi:hypothetical protein
MSLAVSLFLSTTQPQVQLPQKETTTHRIGFFGGGGHKLLHLLARRVGLAIIVVETGDGLLKQLSRSCASRGQQLPGWAEPGCPCALVSMGRGECAPSREVGAMKTSAAYTFLRPRVRFRRLCLVAAPRISKESERRVRRALAPTWAWPGEERAARMKEGQTSRPWRNKRIGRGPAARDVDLWILL